MSLRDRDYMRSETAEAAEPGPRRSIWLAAFALLVLASFLLSVLL